VGVGVRKKWCLAQFPLSRQISNKIKKITYEPRRNFLLSPLIKISSRFRKDILQK